MKTNVLYYGDNLDILRRYIPDESVDLVCLVHAPYQQAQRADASLAAEQGELFGQDSK